MAASVLQQTQVVLSPADEKWVLLQGDGDTVNEQLLEEQDGDARRGKESSPNAVEAQLSPYDLEKFLWWCRYGSYDMTGVEENIRNAAERLESAQVTEKFFWWWRSAWNDAFVRKTLWEDNRLYILIAGLSASTVFQESWREDTFGWFPQLLADMARVYVLTAAVVPSAALVFLMGTDVKVTLRATSLHYRIMMEYRKLVASGRVKGRADWKPSPYLIAAIFVVPLGMMLSIYVDILFLVFSQSSAHPGHAALAATGDI
ncbi:hypothetical protein HPB52_000648 [Rhipicephalus sanguineus]|uniref:Uncharacterized protein n=1 Tax=Rhipicephalus sanguineus TaxID=34632 RepID=A0A9D4QA86_RHISA|nr:hypothetical protein HPB52_000648 [Rhipicephalus sanguineus]